MGWIYESSTGRLLCDGALVTIGYSGRGAAKNRPELDHLANEGPIPCGRWRIGPAYDHPRLGGCVLPLIPAEGTDTHGRSEFRIHGDSRVNPGWASHGCIIIPHDARERLSRERVREIWVVATLPEVAP